MSKHVSCESISVLLVCASTRNLTKGQYLFQALFKEVQKHKADSAPESKGWQLLFYLLECLEKTDK